MKKNRLRNGAVVCTLPVSYTHLTIDKLIRDRNNKGLVIYVESPGGGIYESDELYLKLKEYKEMCIRDSPALLFYAPYLFSLLFLKA